MSPKRVPDLLDRLPCLRSACDVDLLLFFHRHPRTLMPVPRLADYVGYDTSDVTKSLDTLVAAGILVRVPGPSRGPRMYVLTSGGSLGGWLDALLRLASTRGGRLAVLAALAERKAPPTAEPGAGTKLSVARSSPRRRQFRPRSAMEVRHA